MNTLTELTYFRGRVALCAILRGLGVQKGDNVVTQAFTCLAVPEGIMAAGAVPLYADVAPDGFTMSPEDLAKKISAKTKAIIIQHTFGIPADMAGLLRIADARNTPVIEDCCHTIATSLAGKRAGSFGMASFYSFEWGKPLVAGLGGSAIVNDRDLQSRMLRLYVDSKPPSFLRSVKIEMQYMGYKLLFRPQWYWPVKSLFHRLSALGILEGNYNPIQAEHSPEFALRMSTLGQRRLARKLADCSEAVAHSKSVAACYRRGISNRLVSHPVVAKDADPVYARYPLLTGSKKELLDRARQEGIELADWYSTPIHPLVRGQWEHVGYEEGSCPNAERIAGQVVSLPTHANTSSRYVKRVIDFLNEANL